MKLDILRVVVKCDIEGGELGVVTDMVVTGAMEVVDYFHFEWHHDHDYDHDHENRWWTTCTWSGTGCRARASSGLETRRR